MATSSRLFAIVMGIALLLSGIGFIVLVAFGMVRVTADRGAPRPGACDHTGRGLASPGRSAGRPRDPGGLRHGHEAPIWTMRCSSA